MGKRYVPHSDLCGCERCAVQWDSENPQQVFDAIEDPNFLNCGCNKYDGCNCAEWDEEFELTPRLEGKEMRQS
jgi:hypothetical protein